MPEIEAAAHPRNVAPRAQQALDEAGLYTRDLAGREHAKPDAQLLHDAAQAQSEVIHNVGRALVYAIYDLMNSLSEDMAGGGYGNG